jgi:hypothetical protein
LSGLWQRAKDRAPRQKTIATVTATVRRSKPGDEQRARTALIDEAAKHGVTDLSEKELRVMVEAVTTSAREAASSAVSKTAAGAKSMWARLQTSTPAWVELPDNVAALNLRSDQNAVAAPVSVEEPDVVRRLVDELPANASGAREVDCWLSADETPSVAIVHVGKYLVGRVDAAVIADVLARRRVWTPAVLRDGELTVQLPDRP